MKLEKKINILYIPSLEEGGVFYYRCLTPMVALKNNFPDKYEIFITNDLNTAWLQIKNIDILIIHNCLYDNNIQMKVWNLVCEAKKIGIKTVLDMDDYWDYGKEHPIYGICMANQYPIKAVVNLNLFDCITTTTERFKLEICKYNKNVHILENAISKDDPQFTTKKNESKKVRLGLTGGSSHTNDIKLLINEKEVFTDCLSKYTGRNVQLVLCGFNIDGKRIKIDENGKQYAESLNPDEIWWVQLEKIITRNYTTVSKEYAELLMKYDHSDEKFDASDEPYKRMWSKSITKFEYGKVYENIDVLLVPLTDTFFNAQKSELKFTESGFTNTAIITSGVKPYTDYGVDGQDCLFVHDLNPKAWAEQIQKLVNNPDLREKLAVNLHEKSLKERDIDLISKKRDKLYSSIVKK